MGRRKHLSYRELEDLLAEAQETVPVGSIWRHFKGGDYRVLRVVFDSESLQLEVVHESIKHPKITFTRSLTNWLESVDYDGYTLPRFEHMKNE